MPGTSDKGYTTCCTNTDCIHSLLNQLLPSDLQHMLHFQQHMLGQMKSEVMDDVSPGNHVLHISWHLCTSSHSILG